MMPRPPISQRGKKVARMPKERRERRDARREAREKDLAPLKAPTPKVMRREARKEERERRETRALTPRAMTAKVVTAKKRKVEMTKKTDHQRKRKSSPKRAGSQERKLPN